MQLGVKVLVNFNELMMKNDLILAKAKVTKTIDNFGSSFDII